MHHFSGFMFHEDQNIEWFEEDGMDDGEVTSPYFASMILEEGFPILAASSPHLFHIFANGVFMQLNAQFEQLTLDLLGFPERILLRHLPDEVDGLLGDAGLVALRFKFPPPIPAKQIAMPSQECLRLHNV